MRLIQIHAHWHLSTEGFDEVTLRGRSAAIIFEFRGRRLAEWRLPTGVDSAMIAPEVHIEHAGSEYARLVHWLARSPFDDDDGPFVFKELPAGPDSNVMAVEAETRREELTTEDTESTEAEARKVCLLPASVPSVSSVVNSEEHVFN